MESCPREGVVKQQNINATKNFTIGKLKCDVANGIRSSLAAGLYLYNCLPGSSAD